MSEENNEAMNAFLSETGELVEGLGAELVELEAHPRDTELLNAVLRAFHTIKGTAGFLCIEPMVELSHQAESLLDAARHERVQLRTEHIDRLLQVLDVLGAMLRALHDGKAVPPAPPELVRHLRNLLAADAVVGPERADPAGMDEAEFETLLDRIHGPAGAPAPGTPDAAADSAGSHADQTVRIDTTRIDALIDAADELAQVRDRLTRLAEPGSHGALAPAMDDLDRVTDALQAAALHMRLQPIGELFQRFPRIVRDAARRLGKQVVLERRGGDTTLDRSLVESLADPLIHLLRNAIDHGLEDPASRRRAGKSPHGTITLSAARDATRILITVQDDGRGMDPETLREAAVARGLMTPAEARALTPDACRALIFRPGFSTSAEVSALSGRGVGLDVVRTGVAAFGGAIEVESTVGVGTTIRIGIPLPSPGPSAMQRVA